MRATTTFYRGKQVTIVVGFTSAGTYDATARLFARHLGKYLPGKPTVIVRNMPGAGSLVAANSLYSSAPEDGTTLGVIGGGVVLEPLLGNPQATYDPRRFNWIGGRTRDNFLCLVWHTVAVRTLQDVIQRETVVGATGPGSRTLTYPRALNELLGTKFKVVSGYPGGNEITLALERGEVEGYCGWALGSIKTRAPEWLRDGKVRPLAQFTLGKSDLPGVPLATELARNDRERRAIEFFAADFGSGMAADGAARPARGTYRRITCGLRRHDERPRPAGRGEQAGSRRRSGQRRRDGRPGRPCLWHAARCP